MQFVEVKPIAKIHRTVRLRLKKMPLSGMLIKIEKQPRFETRNRREIFFALNVSL
jgi:hypothetical protein